MKRQIVGQPAQTGTMLQQDRNKLLQTWIEVNPEGIPACNDQVETQA